ncbi:MAG: hypothetical protein GXO40_04590 [Epsilonproteobacteria bacterium]|nr:hypothetical protein [Campylobacterota bacterium]
MKTKQKSVRVFEIVSNNYEKVTNFIEKKGILLKRFLLVIKTDNKDIINYFQDKPYEVRFVKPDFDGSDEVIQIEDEEQSSSTTNVEVNTVDNADVGLQKTEIFDRIIRSGSEIRSTNKLVFLQKINAGAKVYSTQEIEIFAGVEGDVVCDGEYMIVKQAKENKIIFQNETLPAINKLSFISKHGIKELE